MKGKRMHRSSFLPASLESVGSAHNAFGGTALNLPDSYDPTVCLSLHPHTDRVLCVCLARTCLPEGIYQTPREKKKGPVFLRSAMEGARGARRWIEIKSLSDIRSPFLLNAYLFQVTKRLRCLDTIWETFE